MPIDLLPIRLALSIPTAIGAWLLVAGLCTVLRLRDPRLRGLLTALGVAEVLCTLFGLPCLSFFFFELRVSPALVSRVIAPVAPYALAGWAGLAGGLITWRLLRASEVSRLLAALALIRKPPATVVAEVARAAEATGVRTPPQVLLVPGGGTPFVAGLRRPRLVIPIELWDRLDGPARRAMLLHEMAHVRRFDNVRLFVAGLIADAFFFNWPLRRLVARWLHEREAVADLAAKHHGATPLGLARSLLASHETGRPLVRAGLAMSGGRGSAARRLLLVARPPRRVTIAAQLLLLACLLPWNLDGLAQTDVSLAPQRDGSNGRVAFGLSFGRNPLMQPLLRHALRATLPSNALPSTVPSNSAPSNSAPSNTVPPSTVLPSDKL